MTAQTAIADRLAKAALEQAARHGWGRVSVATAATAANIPLAEAYAAVADKPALLRAVLSRTDRLVLADGPADAEESPRDRLFEILMRRFDALNADRDGYRAVLQGMPGDPIAGLLLLPHFAASMGWMLEAARLSSSGLLGNLRIKAVAAVYLNTLRTWIDDDSADMARTMAALDTGLRQAEAWADRLSPLTGEGRSRRHTGEHEMPPSADEPASPSGPDATA